MYISPWGMFGLGFIAGAIVGASILIIASIAYSRNPGQKKSKNKGE